MRINNGVVPVISFLFAFILIFVGIVVFEYSTVEIVKHQKIIGYERIVEIKHKESSTSKWIVMTEDEVFESTDSILFLKFNSSDIVRTLKTGNTYTIKVNKLRIPFLSSYRNILSVVNQE